MKKLLTILCITATLAFVANAEEGAAHKKKKEVSPEMKALLEKYDTNKDGKLDKEEKGKMSEADKAKLKELSPRRAKPADKPDKEAAPAK